LVQGMNLHTHLSPDRATEPAQGNALRIKGGIKHKPCKGVSNLSNAKLNGYARRGGCIASQTHVTIHIGLHRSPPVFTESQVYYQLAKTERIFRCS
jgi:hypothetical protein